MTNKKGTKRSLLMSALAMLLCVSLLIGSTFAWFTDSVTSAGNIIKSGTLDVEMYWADGTEAVPAADSADWKNAADGAIFNYDQWEPGYTEVRHIKIANVGTLALKYQLNILPNGEVSKLADAIDVYYLDPAAQLSDRASIDAQYRLGTLTEVLAGMSTTASGELLPKEGDTITIALKMQEGATNEYQGLSIGSDFSVQLLATQLTSEFDSFDNQYDVDADYVAEVKTADELATALRAGGLVKLANDISVTETLTVPAGVTVNLDLNGKTITGTKGRDADGNRVHVIVNNGNAVIKNGAITSAGVNGGSAIYNADGATLTVENVTLNGAPQEGSTWPSYTVNNYGTLTVSDSSIYGVQGIIATNNTANTTVNNVIAYRDGWSSGHVFYTSSTAKVTINGGTYTNDGNGVDGTMIYGGETVVNGGTFIVKEGAYFALCSGSKLTVNGGDFSNIKSCIAWGGAMTISGGTFGFNPTAYVANGYVATKNADGTYTVVKGATVANVADLTNAIANGGNIVLTEDIAITNTLMTTKDVVIDLNGNTMTTPSSGAVFQSQSNASPDITITSSVPGAAINVSGGDTAVLLGYGSTVIENVTINVTGCDNYSPNPFNVYGDLTLGEGTVVNVDYLGTALISNNGAVNIVIDGAEINIGTFKRNGVMIDLNNATTFEMKNTTMKIDTYVLSQFGGEGLINKIDGITIENCTFDITDSNGASCTFVADAGLGRYDLVQK